jgi:hypothetical protein
MQPGPIAETSGPDLPSFPVCIPRTLLSHFPMMSGEDLVERGRGRFYGVPYSWR